MVNGKLVIISAIILSVIAFDISNIYVPDGFERPYEYRAKAVFMKASGILVKLYI